MPGAKFDAALAKAKKEGSITCTCSDHLQMAGLTRSPQQESEAADKGGNRNFKPRRSREIESMMKRGRGQES